MATRQATKGQAGLQAQLVSLHHLPKLCYTSRTALPCRFPPPTGHPRHRHTSVSPEPRLQASRVRHQHPELLQCPPPSYFSHQDLELTLVLTSPSSEHPPPSFLPPQGPQRPLPSPLSLPGAPTAHGPHTSPASGPSAHTALTSLPPRGAHRPPPSHLSGLTPERLCASCSNGASTAQPKPPCLSTPLRAAIGCCKPRRPPIGCGAAEARPAATPVSKPWRPEDSAGRGGCAACPSAAVPSASPLGQQHCGHSSLLLPLPPLHCLISPRHRWLLGSCLDLERSGEIATLAPPARAVFWGKAVKRLEIITGLYKRKSLLFL